MGVEHMKEISVIIPVYNEEKNLFLLYQELNNVLVPLRKTYEIIFIDDGSKDNSLKILKQIALKDKNIKVIELRKNFGQTAAFSAGFDNAQGNILVTMDSDLQNDPRDIPRLIEEINKGYDVVSGWRFRRRDSFTKKITSFFSNKLARKLTRLNIHDFGCSLKAYKKEAIESVELYGEMHRYIPALVAMKGFKVCEIKVNHRQRKHGKTKYGINRLLKGFLDLTYIKFWSSYSTRPLHFFGLLGIFQYFMSLAIIVEQIIKAIIIKKLVVGPLLLLAVLLIITGTLFIIFGFLGEIIIRTYFAKTGEKTYSIRNVFNK